MFLIFLPIWVVGWNDVGYHNEQVISPNIDRLASEGITLGRNQVEYRTFFHFYYLDTSI